MQSSNIMPNYKLSSQAQNMFTNKAHNTHLNNQVNVHMLANNDQKIFAVT